MKKLITTISVLIFFINAHSQVSGYQGKHFILKTDLSSLVDLGGSASLEMAIGRHISIEPEYRFANKTVKFEALNQDNYDRSTQKAKFQEHSAYLTLKFFHSKSNTAPKGFYTFLKGGMGRATITGTDYFYSPKEPENPFDNPVLYQLKNFTFKNVRTYHISAGMGVNYIFAKILVADIYWGLQYSKINAKQYNNDLGNYVGKFAPNVVNFIPSQSDLKLNLGFTFRASFGILLF